MNDGMKRLEELASLLDRGVTKDDFEKAFKIVLDTIDSFRKGNSKEFDLIHKTIEALSKKVQEDATTDIATIRVEALKVVNKALKDQTTGMNLIRDKVRSLKDGRTPKISDIVPQVLQALPPDVEETPTQVRDKLETLIGDERLDKSAIKGIEQLEENIRNIEIRPVKGGGAKGFGLYINSSKKLLTAQYLNLIGGSGVTLTYNLAGGRNDVTISSSGSGGGGILAATGTVNGTNAVFTFASAPSQVIVDGVPKQKTQSDGTSNWSGTLTITLTVAPVSDIYGIT